MYTFANAHILCCNMDGLILGYLDFIITHHVCDQKSTDFTLSHAIVIYS